MADRIECVGERRARWRLAERLRSAPQERRASLLAGYGALGCAAAQPTLLEVITQAGLTANLQLCVDVGDPNSYAGAQTLADRSGNGYDFHLGADGSATASDPTYVPNGRRSYLSHDGGDYLTLSVANPTWVNNLHKNNAAWSWLTLFYKASGSGVRVFGTDGGPSTNIGCSVEISGVIEIEVNNGAGGASMIDVQTTTVITGDAWNIAGGSLNEAAGAGGSFFYANGSYAQVSGANTWDATYASPSSSSATYTMQLGSFGNAASPSGSGTLLSCTAFWSSALSKANFDTLFAALRKRFAI